MNDKPYGKELIIDLHNCDISTFTRKSIKQYFAQLCILIDMKPEKLCWWDDYGLPKAQRQTEPHLKGTSAVQFILTSNITIHTLELLGNAYINIFTCKDFNVETAETFTKKWFKGEFANRRIITRY